MADVQRPLGGLNRPAHANIHSGPARPRHAAVSDRPQPAPAPAAQPAAPAEGGAARRIRRSDGETRITRSFPAQKDPAPTTPEPPGPAPGTPAQGAAWNSAPAQRPTPVPPPAPGANAPGRRGQAAGTPQPLTAL